MGTGFGVPGAFQAAPAGVLRREPNVRRRGGFSCDAWRATTARRRWRTTATPPRRRQLVASCPTAALARRRSPRRQAPPIDPTDAGHLAAEIIGAIIAVPVAVCCLIAIDCGIYVCTSGARPRAERLRPPRHGRVAPGDAYGGKSDSRLIVGQTAASVETNERVEGGGFAGLGGCSGEYLWGCGWGAV